MVAFAVQSLGLAVVLCLVRRSTGTSTDPENTAALETPWVFYTMLFLSTVGATTILILAFNCWMKVVRYITTLPKSGCKTEDEQCQNQNTVVKKVNGNDCTMFPTGFSEVYVSNDSSVFHVDCFHLSRPNTSYRKLKLCKNCAIKLRR